MRPEAPTYPSDLPKKPLVEAIFELRWALQSTTGRDAPQVDPGFRFLLGRYQERIQGAYPHARELPAAQIPEEMAPFVVRHQFRATPNGWPVTQLGPGILTVNDTSGYTWGSFESMILDAAHAVFEAYPQSCDVPGFQPIGVSLRYQNAMTFDPDEMAPREFLRAKLHTELVLDADLFEGAAGVQEPSFVNVSSVFPLAQLPGEASIRIASGEKDGSPAVILDISVRSKGDAVPKDRDSLQSWLAESHKIAERWFFTLCRGDLLAEFEVEGEESA